MRRALVVLATSLGLSGAFVAPRDARGQNPAASASVSTDTILPEAPAEAPPPPPRHKGVVVESSLGALGFLGKFSEVAPPAYWLHLQVGYEALRWLMVFAEGELALTDTSVAQDPVRQRAFPIFGFGGGVRFTVHPTERFAFYGQGSIIGMKADVPQHAFLILGYRDAENLNPSFGGRFGLEWYQIDRHLAVGAAFGIRVATGFKQFAASGSDTPLMWDGSLSIRYTF